MVQVLCFIPCSARKQVTPQTVPVQRCVDQRDLPRFWAHLKRTRELLMERGILQRAGPAAPAFWLYRGCFYCPLHESAELLLNLIKEGVLRLLVISGGYGLIDVTEPIRPYNAVLSVQRQGNATSTARLWREAGLHEMIAEVISTNKPKRVFGFFAGDVAWSRSNSKYRCFFTEGVRIARQRGIHLEGGCFYRLKGRGATAINDTLGRTLIHIARQSFSVDVARHFMSGEMVGSIEIGFEPLI
ncbi:MAG: hypothetical protein DRP63_06055 [Planctomycetota bacterium]|mgnify:FL=1|nr:MAG: hypothetical protein DRP63_06055 [Planctomycetota bacterium]